MVTQAFVPKSELLEWLRQSVRRRENVALKIVTAPQRDTLEMWLSEGRLVHIKSEDRGPFDAMALLAECEQVRFSYASVRASKRRELMSSDVFLKWLDTADGGVPSSQSDANPNPPPPDSDDARWSGTLRGGQSRKGSAGLVVALVVAALVIAVAGFFIAGGDFTKSPGETKPAVNTARLPTQDRRTSAEPVDASIGEFTTWRAGGAYRLDGLVFVEDGAQLVIEPGVIVFGGPGAALIVTRHATIRARGTAAEPIVFTSAQPEGQRASGDWGGVVLLGDAPINRGEANLEGLRGDDPRGEFGGEDRGSNCGVFEYVRIEFPGHPIGTDNELNGLTLGGCGHETLVRHVQVHRSHDDGIEILGGSVDLKYVFISHARDDSVDWDMGWTGRAQFLIVQQHPDAGDNGFEGGNWDERPSEPPISRPRIHNVTMVGSRNPVMAQRAMVLRHGSGGEFRNFVITGFPLESIDLRGELTAERIASNSLSFAGLVMSQIGPGGESHFADESGSKDDDGGFDERDYFSRIAPDIQLTAPDPLGPGAFDLAEPDFTPVAAYIGAGSDWSPPSGEGFWDEAASYYGAVRYGGSASWMDGWTASPEN